MDRIKKALPVLVGMGIAKDVIPGMHDKDDPARWTANRVGAHVRPTRGAIMGALIYEGLAADEREAEKLAASGEIEYDPCHHHQHVGPMAGIVSPSMPVFIFENKTFGNKAYCTQTKGWGKSCVMAVWVKKSMPD